MTDPQFTQVLQLVGTMFTGVMAYFMAKLNSKSADANAERKKNTEEIKKGNEIAETKLTEISKTIRNGTGNGGSHT